MRIKILIIFTLFNYIAHTQETSIDTTLQKRLVKFPLFTSDYFHYPKSNFNTETGKGEVEINEWKTSFQVVIPLKERKTYLLNGINYSLFNYHTTIESSNLNIQETYHSIGYSVGLINILSKKWKLIFNLAPTISGDFNESLSTDDFILQLSALALKRANENFQYGFGFTYTNRFGNFTLFPLINLTYKKNKWLTLAVIPSYVSQFYNINEKSRIGIKAAIYGNLYNVDFDNMPSTIDLNRISYSRITIGPEFQFKLFGDLYLNTSTGFTVRNIIKIQDDQLNTELDLNVDDTFFFNVGLRILK
ncbi:DUF6268 family outer membrane beta-barrel protein [Flavivirga amylovorans]|uniref:DUF6268 family outer membrane beta-barrel protein n=1 Tax=Flavivirga amylovorans TaxID=870486 RepID=A0ABT8WW88_9FLAO|nr:DUF6268 family outer membrane beta-barrel protein [Flavivirga amylovorans]MDO5985940.1 DUF6268 family outer membrane beta-barrel protein [Flavivirga amylovorans]